MNICDEIRRRREAFGMPVKLLAFRAGVSPTTLREIEAGRQAEPKLKTLEKILDALDCDLTITRRMP